MKKSVDQLTLGRCHLRETGREAVVRSHTFGNAVIWRASV